jgi:hypothetical protein
MRGRPRGRQPEPGRWPPCARCGDCYKAAVRWPEGPVCNYCYNKAKRRRGTCAACPHEGVLPGLDEAGAPTCRPCSGIDIPLDCRRCGAEDVLYRAGTCQRCAFGDDLTALLAGPDGTPSPELARLRDALTGMPQPRSGIAWLRMNPKVPALLRSLGCGELAITHEALDGLPASRTLDYLRELLVEHALLPPRDARLARYSSWLEHKLAGITDPDVRQLAERFGRWHHLRRLRDQARQGEVGENAFLRAKQSTTVAVSFLGWLTDRGRRLGDCTQHDLDAWFAGGTSTRGHAGVFLYWARNQRLLPRLDISGREPDSHPELGGQDRLRLLRGVLLHETLPLPHRVAAGLLRLFGQPAHRIAALRVDQVHRDGSSVRIRLAEDVLDVPEPLAALLSAHLDARPNRAADNRVVADPAWLALLPADSEDSYDAVA